MRFTVLPYKTIVGSSRPFGWYLVQDNFNDLWFYTSYHLHYVNPRGAIYIGEVKILKRGQKKNEPLQIQSDFETLPSEFASVGQSLDYYQRLADLGPTLRDEVLLSLCDAVSNPNIAGVFASEPGWKISLFRNFSEDDDFLSVALALIKSDYTSMPSDELAFSIQMKGWGRPVKFEFTGPYVESKIPSLIRITENTLPGRLIAVIGRNGSGKSTMLARIARIAHASVKGRNHPSIGELGSIIPGGIGFPRIITISYSAFDSFRLPGIEPSTESEEDERLQIIQDVKNGGGRFIFCGLRDIASELNYQIAESKKQDIHLNSDRQIQTILKSIEILANEFVDTVRRIQKNERQRIFVNSLKILTNDASFSLESENDFSEFITLLLLSPKKLFLDCSTGHKIVLQIIASLAANITPRSLILIDEPETHLHPPLLSALMRAIRYLLDEKSAFAIVATHSPVVLQETLGQHVCFVQRDGAVHVVAEPTIETFGADIGSITDEVFRLNTEATNFHKTLDSLISEYESVEAIDALFRPYGLSVQARAYVMSQLARKGSKR